MADTTQLDKKREKYKAQLAVALQEDMELVAVVDVAADWRTRMALERGMPLYAASPEQLGPMRKAGVLVSTSGLLVSGLAAMGLHGPKASSRSNRTERS